MKIHYLQHVPFENPASILQYAEKKKIEVSGTALFQGHELPDTDEFNMLVVMGGPMGIHDEGDYPWLREEKLFVEECMSRGKKILGICLGAQLIADVLGADVIKNKYREIGWFPVTGSLDAEHSRFGNILPDSFYAFHWHGDTFEIPSGAVHLFESEACPNQAFVYDERILSLQFHLESTAQSIDLLVENCSDEIDGSRYVQPVNKIRDMSHIDKSNALMWKILDEMNG